MQDNCSFVDSLHLAAINNPTVGSPSVEIRLHFSSRWEEKLLCGSVKPSPATLIRVAFKFSNLDIGKLKPKEQMLFRF